MLVASTETGLREEVSSTTTRRPSSSGSTKRINSESSPCSREPISELSFPDSQLPLSRLSKSQDSHSMIALVTSLHAQLISALLLEPQFTSNCPNWVHKWTNSRLLLINTMCRSEASMVSTLSPLTTLTIFRIRGDSADRRLTWYRICTMASKL